MLPGWRPQRPITGLIGARVSMEFALKVGGHLALTATAWTSRRQLRWLAAGTAAVAADTVGAFRLREAGYLPGRLRAVYEILDAALWARVAGPGGGEAAPVLMVDSACSALLAGWRAGAGTSAVPVYDPATPWPPEGWRGWTRTAGRVAVPVVGPYVAVAAVRRGSGRPTHWSNLTWGLSAAVFGFAFARHRDQLQRQSRRLWEERLRESVAHEHAATRFRVLAASSPGHDFKKTLFALGLAGSNEALAAARAQGARPGDLYRRLPGQLLAEASHRPRVEPHEQGLRLLTEEQAATVQRFLADAAEAAGDGLDQTLKVRERDHLTIELTYLGSRLELRTEPPPLTAELNPTAGAFLVGAVLKARGLVPFDAALPPALTVLLVLLDAAGAVRFWRRPVTANSADDAVRLALIGAVTTMAAAGSRLARTADGDGSPLYPAVGAARDLLLVLLTNWDLLRRRQKALAPAAVAAAVGVTAFRRRALGPDHKGRPDEVGAMTNALTNALALFRAANRVEQEAVLLEREMFDRYAAALAEARRKAEAEEMAAYAEQLAVARRALASLDNLDEGLRREVEADCRRMAEWLRRQGVAVPPSP